MAGCWSPRTTPPPRLPRCGPGPPTPSCEGDFARPPLGGASRSPRGPPPPPWAPGSLLDLRPEAEVRRLVAACVGAGCPALLTLSVPGRVDLTPADPLDRRVAAAFDAHQRRGGLLGPEAVAVAAEEFRRSGAKVIARP